MPCDIPHPGPDVERRRPTPLWRALGEVSSARVPLRGVCTLLTSGLQAQWLLRRRPQPCARFR